MRRPPLRDLRSLSDADADGQVWATALANTLLLANRAAAAARERSAERLEENTRTRLRNHYLGALANGKSANRDQKTALGEKARVLIARFR